MAGPCPAGGWDPRGPFIGLLARVTGIFNSNVDSPISPPPPLHLRGDVAGHSAARRNRHRDHAGGHFPLYRYPRGEHCLDLRRSPAGRDGKAHRDHLRARHDHLGERHRTHRIAILLRRFRDPGLPASQGQSGSGDDPDRSHVELHSARDAARNLSTQHFEIRRVQRPHPAVGTGEQDPQRAAAFRYRPELYPHPAGHGARRGGALALWRQVAGDHGGSGSGGSVRQTAFRHRCFERVESPESDSARR